MRHPPPAAYLLALVLTHLACATPQSKRALIEQAFESDETRGEFIEATLRVLDGELTYVDELFVAARGHPRTLERFVADTARALDDEELAQLTAKHLVQWEAGLHQVLIQTLRAARDSPEARAAIATAVQQEASIAAEIFVDDPHALGDIMRATVRAAMNDPNTREILRTVVQEVVTAAYGSNELRRSRFKRDP